MEVFGIASVFPFLAVLSNPETIESNAYLAKAYNALGFNNTNSFLFFLSVVVFIFLVARTASNAITQYAIMHYCQMRGYSLSTRLLNVYLHRPYSWFLNRHTAELQKNVLSEVGEVVGGMLLPAMRLLSQLLVAALVIALVFIVEPFTSLIAAAVIGGSYLLVYIGLRQYLLRIGEDKVRANRERFQNLREAMGGIKAVKVMGMEDAYAKRFQKPAGRFARNVVKSFLVGLLPRHVLELILFGGMLLLIMWLLASQDDGIDAIIPMLGLYALAGYRLLPALQQVFQSLTKLRFSKPALDHVYEDMMLSNSHRVLPVAPALATPLKLRASLELVDVKFTYPQAERPALQNVTLTISANTTVGVVGGTGAGKSTFVDLILGLLQPQSGKLCVDGVAVTSANVRAWQRSIGYVPQSIFLSDETVAGNIAFGIAEPAIDMGAVERAAKIANLDAFVTSELPNGYLTMVGEGGIRLSGGQCQRIGIARALYHDPDVLIFDEATSALDNLTERAVMDAIHRLGHRKTIILIAHRLTTVEECDKILLFENGKLSASGTYDQLLSCSDGFREMATRPREPCPA